MRALVLQSEQLADDVAASHGTLVGTVRFAILRSLSDIVLIPSLTTILSRFPRLEMRVREGFGDQIGEWLLTGQADVALLYSDRSILRRDGELFMSTDLYLVGASDRQPLSKPTIALKEVALLPMILPASPNRWRLIVEDACAGQNLLMSVVYELDSVETIKKLLQTSNCFSSFLSTQCRMK